MSRGRRAALPPAGFRPQQRLRSDDNRLVVRFVPEDGKSVAKDYDFTVFPVTCQLQTAFAQAFVARTKPGAGLRSTSSTDGAFGILASFAHYLGSLVRPPDHAGELTAAQVNTWLLQRSHLAGSAQELGGLKLLLKRAPGISPEFAAAMNQSHKRSQSSAHDQHLQPG